jgi:regulator of cell morphogenesis and NO signaling
MDTISEQTVREIAVANPASTRVFETLGIDYCCGGNRSLSIACALANVPLENVLRLLDEAALAPGDEVPDGAPLRDLTRFIVERHHAYVRSESPRIQGLFTKVRAKHGPAHPELAQLDVLFAMLSQELAEHMLKEEKILFPYIQSLGHASTRACFATIESPIAVMIAEHENAGAILGQLRALSNGYQPAASACPSFQALYRALEEFERDLHRHVHLENNILFPRAIAAERAYGQTNPAGESL